MEGKIVLKNRRLGLRHIHCYRDIIVRDIEVQQYLIILVIFV